MTLFTISLVLFVIMDPIGNVATFLSMVKNLPTRRQAQVILREMFIALGFMLLFAFIGDWLFNFLNISEPTIRLSSGIILFLIALQIIFPHLQGIRDRIPSKDEPFIIPMAIPLISGPSLLATIMLYSHIVESNLLMLGAILTAWALSTIILLFSRQLYKLFGPNGLMACEKLMGMILILLAIQRFMDGVKLFLASLPAAA